MADLHEIMLDSHRLCALVETGLKEGNLTEDTPTLERVAALSSRLLCRNRAREAAVRFGTALRVTKPGATTSTLSTAAASSLRSALSSTRSRWRSASARAASAS